MIYANDHRQQKPGPSIRQERKAQKLTQEQLAGLTGVGVRFVRELEAERRVARSALPFRWRRLWDSQSPSAAGGRVRHDASTGCLFGETKAGALSQEEAGALSFTYDSDYLAGAEPRAISFSMPLQEAPYADRDGPSFLFRPVAG